MSAADEFPLPPGDPGALKAAGGTLQDVSTDLSAMGTRIGREQAGMAAAWQGDAGAAAGTETGTLATITTEKGGRVGDGASALSDYGIGAGDRGRGGHRDPPAGRPGRDRRPVRGGPVRPGPPVRRPAGDLHQHPVAGARPRCGCTTAR